MHLTLIGVKSLKVYFDIHVCIQKKQSELAANKTKQ